MIYIRTKHIPALSRIGRRAKIMVKCPTCGRNVRGSVKYCLSCNRMLCPSCVPNARGSLLIKRCPDSALVDFSSLYEKESYCSDSCYYQFWESVLSFPPDSYIRTKVENFTKEWANYWDESIMATLLTCQNSDLIERGKRAKQLQSAQFPAFAWWDENNNRIWPADKSNAKAKTSLAHNLERCGRTADAARIFEDLRLYDKARELREKERHIIVKKTDLSVNINSLLQQIKDSGLVALYRCPHCGGNLKIGKNTSIESLRKCEHCNSEIETMDLGDFLRTILS